MTLKFKIVTEGGECFGLGSISRCLSFYDAFKSKGYDVSMVIHGDQSVVPFLSNRRFVLLNWLDDIGLLSEYINESDTIFFDSLTATQEDTDYIESISSLFIVIDDYLRRRYKHAVIIDWTANVEKTNKHQHNINGSNLLLLGIEYSVLRDPFLEESNYHVSDLHRILIIMGGSDIRQLTLPLVTCINREQSDIEISVILGPGIIDKEKMSQKLSGMCHIYDNVDAAAMRDLMLQSDLVISAGGQTLYELAALHVPTIPIQIVDNQSEDLSGLKDLGCFDELFSWTESDLFSRISKKLEELRPLEKRKMFSEALMSLQIGKGIEKIINTIEEEYLNGNN